MCTCKSLNERFGNIFLTAEFITVLQIIIQRYAIQRRTVIIKRIIEMSEQNFLPTERRHTSRSIRGYRVVARREWRQETGSPSCAISRLLPGDHVKSQRFPDHRIGNSPRDVLKRVAKHSVYKPVQQNKGRGGHSVNSNTNILFFNI